MKAPNPTESPKITQEKTNTQLVGCPLRPLFHSSHLHYGPNVGLGPWLGEGGLGMIYKLVYKSNNYGSEVIYL